MKLRRLLQGVDLQVVKGSQEVEVTGLTADSRRVAPGDLFVAHKGYRCDGALFIPEAVRAGAVAILTDLYDPFMDSVVQVIHPDPMRVQGRLAATLYQAPDEALCLVGVTGTNGKTTTSYLIKHLLEQLHGPCGLIGTIEWVSGRSVREATHTTPDLLTTYKLLHEMRSAACSCCAMEVSSHALAQGRVDGLAFDVALFTNLTQDHLDYHGSFEAYANAKARLFAALRPEAIAVVNADTPWSERMVASCRGKIWTYGLTPTADLWASHLLLSLQGTQMQVHFRTEVATLHTALIGRFNVYNLLAAMSVALSQGFSLSSVVASCSALPKVPGRLHALPNARGLHLFVDYAHTEDALANVLQTLRECSKGRVVTVFGCGGDRDRDKRPKMGRVAEALSDLVIITSDNPRSEDPQEIARQILAGFSRPERAIVELDRKQAIEQAVQRSAAGDLLLIAGKGHERRQQLAHQTIDCDDLQIAQEACQKAWK